MPMVKKQLTAQEIAATGLRNQWYAICRSDAVPRGSVQKLTRLGMDWVVFRESSGQVRMLEDRCPHRGAPLSQGQHLGDRIACQYHGVHVDSEGTVLSVPGLPGCNLEGKQLVPSAPVVEVAGVVMAYIGDDKNPQPCELTLPSGSSTTAPRRCCATPNGSPRGGSRWRTSSTRCTGRSCTASRTRCSAGRPPPGSASARPTVAFPYPPTAGPGGPFGIVGMGTPISAEQTAVFFWRYRAVTGWERDTWRFLYKTKLEDRHWHVLEQDRVMLEAMAKDADQAENLYQHDLGVVRLRRLYLTLAERQAAELAETG